MPDHIRYDLLTQQALRSVVRNVLTDAARKGLPGEHHFYISFDTRADGVRLSERLRAQYPEQMTIILQHQFWDLEVGEDGFSVGLSFGGVPEKLQVPFEAIKGFFDPSVQFGLQFEEVGDTEAQPPGADAGKDDGKDGLKDSVRDMARDTGKEAGKPAGRKKLPSAAPAPAAAPVRGPAPAPVAGEAADKPDGPDKPSGGAEVVRLDRFRKK